MQSRIFYTESCLKIICGLRVGVFMMSVHLVDFLLFELLKNYDLKKAI